MIGLYRAQILLRVEYFGRENPVIWVLGASGSGRSPRKGPFVKGQADFVSFGVIRDV